MTSLVGPTLKGPRRHSKFIVQGPKALGVRNTETAGSGNTSTTTEGDLVGGCILSGQEGPPDLILGFALYSSVNMETEVIEGKEEE